MVGGQVQERVEGSGSPDLFLSPRELGEGKDFSHYGLQYLINFERFHKSVQNKLKHK